MAKPRVENETKKHKFKRIATMRTKRILEDLRLLGNCANTQAYEYSKADVDKIFSTVERELKRVKALYNKPIQEFDLE
ncbi:MAG: hypothetical protein ACXV7G_09350 [Halobacteriota archaeon]